MIYKSEKILCPENDAHLTDVEIMERYGEIFGIEPWVSFSGCPAITLTRILNEPSTASSNLINEMCIKIESGCYVDSTLLPSFPSGPTKLTCVSVDGDKYGKIVIGENCTLQGTTICSYRLVSIGNRVLFGPNVVIMDCSGHAMSRRGESDEVERLDVASVHIGDDVWVGYGVIILPGVSIGNNVVIGAGSVVSRDIPDDCVAVGNPCIVKRSINL